MDRTIYSHFEKTVLEYAGERLREWGIQGLSLEDVYLAGTFPNTQLIFVFRHDSRPGCTFGMKFAMWEGLLPNAEIDPDAEVDPDAVLTPAIANIQEEIEAADLGLPTDCSEDKITWLWNGSGWDSNRS